MKLSKRSEYALRALVDMASLNGTKPVPLSALARRNNIPLKFLEQIFIPLKNAGVIRSQAGANGGYWLGRSADAITFGEVIRLLDGTLAPVSCVSQIAYGPCTCPDETKCALKIVMQEVRDAIVAVLDKTTLADAARQTVCDVPLIPAS
jgi:Rrf2 family protein